jgi:hypothetical protein
MWVELDGGVLAGLTLEVEYYSAMAFGGPDRAEIRAIGGPDALAQIAGWLRRAVVIRSDAGTVVWAGYVHETRIGQPGRTVGTSMEEMGNKLKILYTSDDANGVEEATETEWLFDYDSSYRYGQIERRISAGASLRAEEAARMATTELAMRAQPSLTLDATGGEDGLLLCRGWWHTLDWKYYERLTGRVEFTETGGNGAHQIGWQLQSDQIGFFRQWLHHLGAQLGELKAGETIYITGSASNDGTREIKTAASGDAALVTSTTLYFEASDDIRDPASGMGDLSAPGMIYISNGGPNTGYRAIEQALPRYLNVEGGFNGGIVDFTPTGTRTIEQGHFIETNPWNIKEVPGATVTISKVSTIAQAWRMPAGESWRLASVAVSGRRVGVPGAALAMEIRTDNAGAPGGTVVASGTLSSVPDSMAWVRFNFDHSWAPTANTVYWLVLSTSSYAHDAYYEVELNTQTLAPEGEALVDTGSGWAAVPTGSSAMLFRVWGGVELNLLLADVLRANPLITQVDVQAGAGVYRHPYAAGDLTLRDAAEKMLRFGGYNAARLSAWVDEKRAVSVVGATGATASDWRWTAENWLVAAGGGQVEKGVLPAGRWVWVDGLPRALEDFGRSVFVERAEYDARTGRMTITPAEALNPLRMGTFELG